MSEAIHVEPTRVSDIAMECLPVTDSFHPQGAGQVFCTSMRTQKMDCFEVGVQVCFPNDDVLVTPVTPVTGKGDACLGQSFIEALWEHPTQDGVRKSECKLLGNGHHSSFLCETRVLLSHHHFDAR